MEINLLFILSSKKRINNKMYFIFLKVIGSWFYPLKSISCKIKNKKVKKEKYKLNINKGGKSG